MRRRLACTLLLCSPVLAQAAPLDAEMGRYLARYPGMYGGITLSQDDGDRSFDAAGQRRDGVAPTYGAGNQFATRQAELRLQWFFPMFETEQIPLVSSRLWAARTTLGYSMLETQGPIQGFITQNGLRESRGGVNDVVLEFGPVLAGSANWREKGATPYSLLLLGRAVIPVGARDADAPHNAGGNVLSWGATLGGYWHPLPRLYLDAGVGLRSYQKDEEPAFGAQTPAQRGDDRLMDATVSLRILRDVYAGLSWQRREGDANTYEAIRFTANPPAAGVGMETFPDPAPVQDGGTASTQWAASLSWFLTQRWRLDLQWTRALSGRSGELDVPYLQQLQGCAALQNCNPQPNGRDHVDGLGSARTLASDIVTLGLRWSFGQGDFFLSGL